MFNSLKKTFESDNEAPNKTNAFNNDNDYYKDKEKTSNIVNKSKVNKFKVPNNFPQKKV